MNKRIVASILFDLDPARINRVESEMFDDYEDEAAAIVEEIEIYGDAEVAVLQVLDDAFKYRYNIEKALAAAKRIEEIA